MLKVALLIAIGIVVIVVVVVVTGSLLPKQHVVARVISVRRSANEVFSLISDVQSAPAWRNDVRAIDMLPSRNEHVFYREKNKDGTITMEIVDSEPPRRLVSQIADKSLPFGGAWIFEVTPNGDGTRLNITERGEVYNPVFRFVSRFVFGYTRTIDTYLGNVARKFGETAVPEPGIPGNL